MTMNYVQHLGQDEVYDLFLDSNWSTGYGHGLSDRNWKVAILGFSSFLIVQVKIFTFSSQNL